MVFVRDVAPGDVVKARVIERHARFWVAEPVEILTASPHRRKPPCPVFGRCGGCTWQHVEYSEQVRPKEKILKDSLRRLEGFELLPFVPAHAEFYYRNRVQLQVRKKRFGFFARRSRELVETDFCWIAEPPINDAISKLSGDDLTGVEKLELAVVEDGSVRAMAGRRDPEAALFAQVNRAQNEVLKRLVADSIEGRPARIFDLYCGSGNLTLPLARRFSGVPILAVELSRAAISRAPRGEDAITWRAGDVGQVLASFSPQDRTVVVLDPPRAGLDRVAIERLKNLAARQLVYVSCDPQTFARDAERLKSKYRLTQVRGLDMFPQTEHVELVASFTLIHVLGVHP